MIQFIIGEVEALLRDALGNFLTSKDEGSGVRSLDVNVRSVLGASTEAKQDIGNASLASIDGKAPALVGGRVPVDPSGVTSPISAVSLPLPSGAATEAKQDAGNAALASIDGKLSNPMPVSGPVTDAQLRSAPVPVSGPLTDAQLRATSVPVSGPLTDAQLRATSVPVSGPLTDAELRAVKVAVAISDAANNALTSKSEGGGVQSLDINLRSRTKAPTYLCGFSGQTHFTVNAGTNRDLITITGSASKVIRVHRIHLSGSGSTAQQGTLSLRKRSSVDTGGTSSALVSAPVDSLNPAATATIAAYTAAPTQGALVAVLAAIRKLFPLAGSGTLSGDVCIFDFTRENLEPITLRGVSEQLAINLSATSGNFAPTLSGFIEFSEE